MAESIRSRRTFTVSKNSRPLTSKGATRSRVLTGNSGYAAAEFNYLSTNFPSPPLVISEPDEDTSSWQQ